MQHHYRKRAFVRIIFIALFMMFSVSQSYANNKVVIGMRLEPPHMDPTAGSASAIDEIVYNNIFEGLLYINEEGVAKPLLAKSWKISADAKTYTFTLQNGVVFHNGEYFNSGSVVFNFTRLSAKDSTNPRASLYKNITAVKALEKNVVQVTLSRPDANFLYNIALPDAVMVGRSSYKNNKTNPIGTGPFVFKTSKKGYFVKLIRNPKYYGEMAKVRNIEFKFYADTGASTAALLSGGVDAFPMYGDTLNLPVLKAQKSLSVVVGTTEGEILLVLNNEHPMLKDIRVRRALNHAIDKDAVMMVVLQGMGEKIGSHFPPHHPAYVDLSNAYPYDVKKSRALLKKAGAENLELELSVPPSYEVLAEILSAQLRSVGIRVTIKKMDWATWLNKVFRNKQYDISVVSHVESRDYDIYGNSGYYFGYKNKKIRQLLEDVYTAKTQADTYGALRNIQKKLSYDAVNVWLYQSPKIGVWKKDLKGLWHNAPVEGTILRNVYWAK